MRIHVQYCAYDGMGYENTLSLCGWFIEKHLGDYGEAIADVWVCAFLPPREPPRATLGSSYDQFVSELPKLPRCRFSRKKKSIDIDAVSGFVHPPYQYGQLLQRTYPISPELFKSGLREVIRIIGIAMTKVTRRDDFNTAAFLSDLEACVKHSPRTESEIEELRQEQFRKFDEDAKKADPWEALGIDWDEYHRSAKKLLNDPFFWEESNDLSPNGNDTGADVLIEYRDWREHNKRSDPIQWLVSLLTAWEVDIAMAPSSSNQDVASFLDRNEFSVNTWDDAAIGLAFTCLKIDGQLSPAIANLALHAAQRQAHEVVIKDRGWRDAGERKISLARVVEVLGRYAKE